MPTTTGNADSVLSLPVAVAVMWLRSWKRHGAG